MTELATELGVSLLRWLGTAWLHATCLLALVWLAERCRLLVHAGWREWAWRCALLVPLASASLQMLAGGALPAPQLGLPALATPAVVPAAPAASARGDDTRRQRGASVRPTADVLAPAGTAERHAVAVVADSTPALPAPVGPSREPDVVTASPWTDSRLAAGLGLLWAITALFGAAWLGYRWRREARRIALLPALHDAGLSRQRDVVCAGLSLRPQLRRDDGLDGPAAWAPDSVCLPPWTQSALSPAQQRASLAHEVAHLLRRDPQWQLATRWLCLLLPSPLTALARRRLAELAEHACDHWAAQRTGDGRALAESLLACAERHAAHPSHPTLAVAMAAPRSPLLARIQHLIEDTPMQFDSAPLRRRGALLAGLIAAVVALPGLARQADVPAAPEAPSAPSAPAAPAAPEIAPAAPSAPAVPAVPAPPAPPAPPAFHGEVSHSESSWLFGRSTELSIRQPGYELEFEAKGRFAFTAAEDDLRSLDDELHIEETRDGQTRRIEFSDSGDGFTRAYEVDGREHAFDAEARQWLAGLLPALLRETAIDAEGREARLFRRGGSEAVLAEIALIRSDYARRRYVSLLLDRPEVSATQLRRVIAEIGRGDSDYETRVALSHVLKHPSLDGAGMGELLQLTGAIDSDYERRVVLQRAARRLPADHALHGIWLAALDGMQSDYEQRVALQELLQRASLQPTMLVKAVEAIDRIGSDYEQRVALESLAEQAGGRAEVLVAYAAALRHIGSDYERRVAVQAVLDHAPVDAAGASGLLDAIAGIGADYERRVALTSLAARMPVDAALIARYREVARSLSSYERGEAEAALDRLAI